MHPDGITGLRGGEQKKIIKPNKKKKLDQQKKSQYVNGEPFVTERLTLFHSFFLVMYHIS